MKFYDPYDFEDMVVAWLQKRQSKDGSLKFKGDMYYVGDSLLVREMTLYNRKGNVIRKLDLSSYCDRCEAGESIPDVLEEIYQVCLTAVELDEKENQEILEQRTPAETQEWEDDDPRSIEQLEERINKIIRDLRGLNDTVDLAMDQMSAERVSEPPQRLFVDMDGTLAVFRQLDTLELLYEEGYFLNLEPIPEVIAAVKEIIRNHPDKEVYIMSSVLSDSHYALKEKNQWLDKYLPEIDVAHRIFPPCGDNKMDYVPDGIRKNDYLLDDYTNNLILWEPPAKGIKLLNGINNTKGIWKKSALRYNSSPKELASNIISVMEGQTIREARPQEQQMEKSVKVKTDKSPQIRAPRR